MKILGIETSCDETAVCVVEAKGDLERPHFRILGDALYSQAKTHAEYGGVFPQLAKREHARNLPPLLRKAVQDAGLFKNLIKPLDTAFAQTLAEILEREVGLFETTREVLESMEKPDIDAIAVTHGPGLEPALWVGINFARALGLAWNIPVIPANHMEGHIVSPLLSPSFSKEGVGGVQFPALALLISGGHTELVLMTSWLDYKVIGKTRDDAVGEAFDKVARLLELGYPGGPMISKLAEEARIAHTTPKVKLPRPMLNTPDYDFSFSGIKTSVLYSLKKIDNVDEQTKKEYALEFENAVTEVLVKKTQKALDEHSIKTLILGGGVVANTYIRKEFEKLISEYSDVTLLIPDIKDSTDNAVMIAAAGYFNILAGKKGATDIKATGNLSF
ncbi:MAG: tRNA (adenosine(37)-N6)-threonylcarbamoyltransferase complex transferase subunit TsaD [bacterium]|nr:tRNA (adenosine(37)-N6)-threonylcarbamoyltransferase complex transferase subunit TsaD [bacterium]